jgi:hypothetical protein
VHHRNDGKRIVTLDRRNSHLDGEGTRNRTIHPPARFVCPEDIDKACVLKRNTSERVRIRIEKERDYDFDAAGASV